MLGLRPKSKLTRPSIPSFSGVRLFGDNFCFVPEKLWQLDEIRFFVASRLKPRIQLNFLESESFGNLKKLKSVGMKRHLILRDHSNKLVGWAEIQTIKASFTISHLFSGYQGISDEDITRYNNFLISFCVFAINSDQIRIVTSGNPTTIEHRKILIPQYKNQTWNSIQAYYEEINAVDWVVTAEAKSDEIKLMYLKQGQK